MSDDAHILYVGSVLPKRSETFVFRELLGLRAAGVRVTAASLHRPDRGLGDPQLDALAAEAVPVYGGGMGRLAVDALRQVCRSPALAAATLGLAARDAVAARATASRERVKLPVQAMAGLALAARVQGRGITHIHAHMAHAPATVAMYAARALGVPFSFTGHAVDLFRDQALLAEKLRRAAFVACISRWHRQWYQEQWRRPEAEYPIVRCGVDVGAFHPTARADSGGPFRLLALGRLVPKKGFDVLLRALPSLGDLDVRVCIAGEGPEHERLAALIWDLAVDGRVALAGSVNPGEVPALLEAADAFVLPCRTDAQGDRDGIPVVLMEAMAAGVCVVSGDLPTLRELVEHDVTGLLVPPDDAPALAAALRRLISDPLLRGRLRAGGRERVEKEFSLVANVASIRLAFERVRVKEASSG